ncbi:cytidylyltransferase domain-containing protein [Carboxylicivirga linearis]|uniref:Glycosyl transferase family 2 n=1 Tax=Carboxylicivirga linearis TaxID=1628157 RepID=A0ABS5K0X0_9BACT|nr:hypothetical protein [Carboxylicivirga linearis]MBS2100774.1 hypothetical protein [Carboxylicivirga linearis]
MIGIIIQARMGSHRLPNKMMKSFYNGKGILECLVDRLKNDLSEIPIVIATTHKKEDDEITLLAERMNIECYRGSEDDVLRRFILCAERYSFTKLIRICADNPFIDISSLKVLINELKIRKVDYASYRLSNSKPVILSHYGFWAEGISLAALKKVQRLTDDKYYHEHVTNFIYMNESEFDLFWMTVPKFIEDSTIRLTVDTLADFQMAKSIYKYFITLKQPTIGDLLSYINKNEDYLIKMKELINLNQK